jgi:hypothetical protein
MTFFMIHKILFLTFILLLYTDSPAQKINQDLQLLSYNIGLNGLAAGVGAIINKHKDQTWYQSFTKGFCQGCLGGLCIYTGKTLTFKINNQRNYLYCWPSRIIYSAGTSIVENAALNNDFGKNWNIDLWLFRCDLSFNEHPSIKARLLLSSIYSIGSLYYVAPNIRLDFCRTAMTGAFIFSTDSLIQDFYQGYTVGNSIAVRTNSPVYNEYHIVAHELIHTYQNNEYEIFNTWLEPLAEKVPANIKMIFDKYLYLDVSNYQLFYLTQGSYSKQYYYKNFYELEAEYFATNQYIPLKRW